MPAAAVIPAPVAYIKVVAVRLTAWCGIQDFHLEEIRVFQAGTRLEYISME